MNYDFEEACKDANSDADTCTIRACMLELYFLENIIIEIQINSESLNNSLKHSSEFDHNSECGNLGTYPNTSPVDNNESSDNLTTVQNQVTPGFSVSNHTIECCGSYPIRFGYKPDNGAHACCGQVTYSTFNHDCCDEENSVLGGFGTCL